MSAAVPLRDRVSSSGRTTGPPGVGVEGIGFLGGHPTPDALIFCLSSAGFNEILHFHRFDSFAHFPLAGVVCSESERLAILLASTERRPAGKDFTWARPEAAWGAAGLVWSG